MRRIFSLTMGLLAGLLFLPSCKSEADIEEPTLELSTSTLTFAKEASEQTLTIQTNKSSWSAFSPEEGRWLTLHQDGTTLRVATQANRAGTDRSTTIIVNAGGLQRKVTVRQAAGDAAIFLDADKLNLFDDGGRQRVTFASNAPSVKVELASQVDWLSIENITPTSFVLVAKANTEKTKRTTKVTLTAGTTIRELEVVQQGIPFYVMPMLTFPAPLERVTEYEQARHHALYRLPDGERNQMEYIFKTRSQVMPLISYEFPSSRSISYLSATSTISGRRLVKDNKEFEAFMAEHGFKLHETKNNGETLIYWNEAEGSEANVAIHESGAKIVWHYYPKQDKAYPTFTKLPMLDLLPFTGNREKNRHGKDRDFIKNQEVNEWKSTLDTKNSRMDYDRYSLTQNFDGEMLRGYFFVVPDGIFIDPDDPYIDEVSAVQMIFAQDKVSLVFFKDRFGEYHPTQEAKAFFKEQGFPWVKRMPQGMDVFYNAKDKRAYVCQVLHGSLGGAVSDFLEIQGYDVDLGIPASVQGSAQQILRTHIATERAITDKILKRMHQTKGLHPLRR